MHIRTSFPYETTHHDLRIPLPDRTQLYARVWRPLTDEPVPALLEYQPYRLTDWTAPRDHQRHPWYAGHGYACVRVDIRGHGNSEGMPTDEYSATELADGVEVVNWSAAQPWCNGRVGMFGIPWGGFNSLQIAALAPEPLKAIVTVCSTDDRYDNDVHYMGGSVLAVDMHAWASTMLAFVARPPERCMQGAPGGEMWGKRLEAVEPFLHTWLGHQTRDDYWHHGSVCEDYSAIDAAVLAVGGWHDPYRDTVLRLVEHLPPDRVRGLIGPWSHQYPDRGLPPGPAIGFLQETVRWWDHWLKDEDTGVMAEPLLRSYVSDSHRPATGYPTLPGRWVGEPTWPSPHVRAVTYAFQGAPVLVRSPMHTGIDAGRFFPFGNDADLPPDQREEDTRSACFEFEAGEENWVLGRPKVRPQADVGGATRAGRRPALRRGAGRLLDPGHAGRAEPVGASRPGPSGAVGTGRDRGRDLRAERHRPCLPARPSHPPGRLLRVLAVDLAPAGLGGRASAWSRRTARWNFRYAHDRWTNRRTAQRSPSRNLSRRNRSA